MYRNITTSSSSTSTMIRALRSTRKSAAASVLAKSFPKNSAVNQIPKVATRAYSSSIISSAEAAAAAEQYPHYPPFEFSTLAEMHVKACEKYNEKRCLGTRVGDKYEWISYTEFGKRVQKFRNVLAHNGVTKGDRVAIISNNRVEWAVAFYGVATIGGSLVPMYEAQLEKDWKYIINDSGAKVVIAANDGIYKKVSEYVGTVGEVKSAICLDADPVQAYSYANWMQKVDSEAPVPVAAVTPKDLATIIYTSGTTGNPKGVELSHENLSSNIKGTVERWKHELNPSVTCLAFLPWAHIFGQTCDLHSMMWSGVSGGIVEKREQILEGLHLVQPKVMSAVPMLFNRVYDGVKKKIHEGPAVARVLSNYALHLARKRNDLREHGKPVGPFLEWRFQLMDKIVLSKIRARICPSLKYMSSGGAAVGPQVLHFFEDIGIPICEGYGLTETAPVISSGSTAGQYGWENRRLGCVGTPLSNVTVKIINPETLEEMPHDTDGEICAAGPSVMVGYRNNKAANDEVFFHKDGVRFFRTGDMGRMVEGKFLKITGRIKEQYKLENGKYVVPAPLEDAMSLSAYFFQALLYGDNKKHNVALVVLEWTEIAKWAKKHVPEIPAEVQKDPDLLIQHPDIRKVIDAELKRVCKKFKGYERPTKWAAINEPFSQENQMLTPKMSIRRNNVLKAYESVITKMYASDEPFHGTLDIPFGTGTKTVSYITGKLPPPKKPVPEDAEKK